MHVREVSAHCDISDVLRGPFVVYCRNLPGEDNITFQIQQTVSQTLAIPTDLCLITVKNCPLTESKRKQPQTWFISWLNESNVWGEKNQAAKCKILYS